VVNKASTLPKPINLETLPVLPFPSDALPGFLREQVEAVAGHTETPIELPALNGLAAIAVCTQGKYEIEVKPGYREPTNIYSSTVLPSGNRKSPAQNEMLAPLQQWEFSKARQLSKDIGAIQTRRDTIQARIKVLRSKAAKMNCEDFEDFETEIAKVQRSMPDLPATPRLWSQDVTPEQLAQLMAENDERMTILSDEGGIFDTMAGRYSNGIPTAKARGIHIGRPSKLVGEI
jgi:hypothetical protein